jgi:flagellar assembly factor FliW
MTALMIEPELAELTLSGGLAGFPLSEHYALVEVPDSPLFLLRSLDVPGLEFVVVPPVLFFPGYAPEIDDASAARLGLVDPEDALLLVVLTVTDDAFTATANLLAPVVLNQRTRVAAQIVLVEDWPLRAPLRP